MKKWIAILVFLSGCRADPVKETQTNNPAIKVELLFEHEGCRCYRFQDGTTYVYYVRCGERTVTSSGGYEYDPVTKQYIDKTQRVTVEDGKK